MATNKVSEEILDKIKEVLVGKVIYRKRIGESGRRNKIGACLGEIRSVSSSGLVYFYNKEYDERSIISLEELKGTSGTNYIISENYI